MKNIIITTEKMSDRIEYGRQMALRHRGVGSVYNWRSPVEGFNGTTRNYMKKMTASILKKQSADLNKFQWTETYQYCQENVVG